MSTEQLPPLPPPDCSYADHSYPAYSKEAMRAYALAAIDTHLASGESAEKPEDEGFDECAASGQSCSYGPHGPRGEMQCEYCGKEKAPQQDDRKALAEAERVLWAMKNGWNIFYNPPWIALTDEANRESAWSCERTVAPFCCNDGSSDRRWSGATPWGALERSIEDLRSEFPEVLASLPQPAAAVPSGLTGKYEALWQPIETAPTT